jgi:hypothetical protein
MMRNELEERLGYKLESWQWEMAHYVYQNHPKIKDVGGKEELALVIKDRGFVFPSRLREMYAELKGPPIVTRTESTLFETYDITHEGFCINSRGNPLTGIYREVRAKLEKEHPELMGECDYFSLDKGHGDDKIDLWPFPHWIAVHYVRGGSEGFYVHVAFIDYGKYRILFLAKTLCDGEAGICWGEQMVCALSRIMEV